MEYKSKINELTFQIKVLHENLVILHQSTEASSLTLSKALGPEITKRAGVYLPVFTTQYESHAAASKSLGRRTGAKVYSVSDICTETIYLIWYSQIKHTCFFVKLVFFCRKFKILWHPYCLETFVAMTPIYPPKTYKIILRKKMHSFSLLHTFTM